MADNLYIQTGHDALVKTDDLGGQHVQYVKLLSGTDGSSTPIKADSYTGSLQVIDYAHHEVHGGSSYEAFQFTSSLNSGSSKEYLIVTPDTTSWAHFLPEVIANGEAEVYLYEDTTVSDNGTGLTEFNRDRNSANTAGVAVYHTPTITGDGTQIWQGLVGSGRSVGGQDRGMAEWILKQNANYLLRVTSRAAGCKIVVRLNWYHHTNL